MLRILCKSLLIAVFLLLSRISPAAEPVSDTQTRNLGRSDIQNIKIMSHKSDKVILYITGKDAQKYRLGNLTHRQAVSILGRMKKGDALELNYLTESATYHDVLRWK